MYINVFFVSHKHSTVRLTLVREHRFIRIIFHYYYYTLDNAKMSTVAIITENCLNLTKLPVNYDGYIQEIAYTVLQCLSK